MDLLLSLDVDGSLDVTSGVLVSESAVDDVELGDFRGVLSVDEIVELREGGEKRTSQDESIARTTRNDGTERNSQSKP